LVFVGGGGFGGGGVAFVGVGGWYPD